MFTKRIFVYAFLFVYSLGPVFSRYYLDHETDFHPFIFDRIVTWNNFLNFEDPENWLPDKRLPCPNDKIKLPPNYAIFLNNKLTVSEIILDPNGELIFGDTKIQFPILNRLDERCANNLGKTLRFVPRNKTSWFSPRSWRLNGGHTSSYDPKHYFKALSNYATFVTLKSIPNFRLQQLIPDSERIPCNGDYLFFPTGNGSFKVSVDNSDFLPHILAVRVGDRSYYRTLKFRRFVDSDQGSLLFQDSSKRKLNLRFVPYNTLSCGNDHHEILQTICQYSKQYCQKPNCKDPIQPIGHCCPICASILLLQPKIELNEILRAEFHLATYHALTKLSDNKVRFYAHWLMDGSFQIIIDDLKWALVEEQEKSRPKDTENDLYSLYYNIRKYHKNLDKVFFLKEMKASKKFVIDKELFDSVLFLVAFLFVVTPIVSFMSVFILLRFYQRNRSDPAFTFVRFQSQTHDIELDIDPQMKNYPETNK